MIRGLVSGPLVHQLLTYFPLNPIEFTMVRSQNGAGIVTEIADVIGPKNFDSPRSFE